MTKQGQFEKPPTRLPDQEWMSLLMAGHILVQWLVLKNMLKSSPKCEHGHPASISSDIAKSEPQAAFSAVTHSLLSKWTYPSRVVEDISHLLVPLDDDTYSLPWSHPLCIMQSGWLQDKLDVFRKWMITSLLGRYTGSTVSLVQIVCLDHLKSNYPDMPIWQTTSIIRQQLCDSVQVLQKDMQVCVVVLDTLLT